MSDELREALELYDNGDPIYPDTLDVLVAAARSWLNLLDDIERRGVEIVVGSDVSFADILKANGL